MTSDVRALARPVSRHERKERDAVLTGKQNASKQKPVLPILAVLCFVCLAGMCAALFYTTATAAQSKVPNAAPCYEGRRLDARWQNGCRGWSKVGATGQVSYDIPGGVRHNRKLHHGETPVSEPVSLDENGRDRTDTGRHRSKMWITSRRPAADRFRWS